MTKKCDMLLTNALVLTMDEDYHLYEPGAVAIAGDNIAAVGPKHQRVIQLQVLNSKAVSKNVIRNPAGHLGVTGLPRNFHG